MATETAILVQSPTRSRFFLGMSGLLLAITVTGFIPTLFLRPFFRLPSMPAYLHAHGFILTAWFVFLVVQASLIGAGRHAWHRLLGIAGVLLMVAVVPGAMIAGVLKASRLQALGVDLEARLGPDSAIFWVNVGAMLIFVSFVLLAVVLRRHPEAHKRLMLLGSINIIGPPLGRFPRWPIFGGPGFETPAPHEAIIPLGGTIVLMLMLIGYDLAVRRKVHPATWIGCASIVLMRVVSVVVAATPAGQGLVRSTASIFGG